MLLDDYRALRPAAQRERIYAIDETASDDDKDLALHVARDKAFPAPLREAAMAALARAGGVERVDALIDVFLKGSKRDSENALIPLALHGSRESLIQAFKKLEKLSVAEQNSFPPASLKAVGWASRFAIIEPKIIESLRSAIASRPFSLGLEDDLVKYWKCMEDDAGNGNLCSAELIAVLRGSISY
jgi:hypothetical protein